MDMLGPSCCLLFKTIGTVTEGDNVVVLMLLFRAPPTVQNHPCVAHRMLGDEEVSEVTVYSIPQGNGTASDEDSGDEKEEASHMT